MAFFHTTICARASQIALAAEENSHTRILFALLRLRSGMEIKMNKSKDGFRTDIEAVITSFNQGAMILEAVESLCVQTLLPQKMLVLRKCTHQWYWYWMAMINWNPNI